MNEMEELLNLLKNKLKSLNGISNSKGEMTMYQYCKICAMSELSTKTRVRCTFWNKWKKHHNWCKNFVKKNDY